MIDFVQKPKDACLYEIRQKGQKDPCYVVVPNPKVRFLFYSHIFNCSYSLYALYKFEFEREF